MKKYKFLLSVFYVIISFTVSAKTIRFVKVDGTGDGSSWANAASNIQTMIDNSTSGDEVWVAKGTYYPTTETIARDARSKTFLLKTGVNLYGGFAGTESAINQRILSDLDSNGEIDSFELVNPTILSGNIDGVADVWTKTLNTDGKTWKWTVTGNEGNCYTVVTASSIIDGFTVIGGNANGTTNINGGGVNLNTLNSFITNSIVANCSAKNHGGGIYTSTNVANCKVNNCLADGNGGGIYISNSVFSSATNCTVSNCSSGNLGGGVYTYSIATTVSTSSSTVNNCKIAYCSAGNSGGGIYTYIFSKSTNSRSTTTLNSESKIINNLISNCMAKEGGGIYAYTYTNSSTTYGTTLYSISSCLLINCTVSNCYAISYGGGIYVNAYANHDSYSNNPPVSSCKVLNCSVLNSMANNGAGIFAVASSQSHTDATSMINNCAVSNNKSGIQISNIVGGIQSENICPNLNQTYITPTSFVGTATTDQQSSDLLIANWRLKEGSSCINAGISTNISSSILSGCDLDNNSRVAYSSIDIGAYEYNVPKINLPVAENFNEIAVWDNSNMFYNSAQLNGAQNIKWNITNQKTQFSWQTNLTSSYTEPIFTYQIDATNATKTILRYDMSFQAYAGTITPLGTEKLNIDYSFDLVTWSPIAVYSNANGTIANNTYKHDLSDKLAGKTFFIRFNANGQNSNRIEKWEIDNVIVGTDGLFTSVHTAQADKYTYVVSNGELVISNLEQSANIQLFDVNGKLMNSSKTEAQTFHFTLPAHGVYMVKVISNNNTETKKIVW